jgi:transposase
MTLTSPFVIELTEAERRGLEQVADSRAAPFGQVQRASVILAVADGKSNAAAARAAGRHVDTVRAWRKRFAAERLAVLADRPRPLGRPRLAPEDKLRIIAAATQTPPGADTAWTHRLLAGHLRISGLAVSASQIGRILNSVDLKPHLVRGWLTRPADPEFFTKAAGVCALYRTCLDNAVVFSVDEKTGITARSRKHPDQPGRPGQRTATNWPSASTTSPWPTTNTTPSPTAGPTTAPRSKPREPPKDQRGAAPALTLTSRTPRHAADRMPP